VFVSPCSGFVCSCCSPSVINKHVFPSGVSGRSGYVYLWSLSSVGSFYSILLGFVPLISFKKVASVSLLHLLLVIGAFCFAVHFLPPWAFYWSFIWFPTEKRLFTSPGRLYRATVFFFNRLAWMLKCFQMSDNKNKCWIHVWRFFSRQVL